MFGLKTVPIVGRHVERDRMWKEFKQVSRQQTARAVVLEGSPGTGKSRLAEWLCERTHEMGLAESLKLEHERTRGGDFGLSYMLAVAWSCVNLDGGELQDRVTHISETAGIESERSRRAVTELLAPAALGDNYTPGIFHQFQSRAARYRSALELLRRVYRDRTLVIWLDDVHWGVDTLYFTRYVLQRPLIESTPIMLVLTARDDLLVESPEASGLLAELCTRGNVECVHVEPLSPAESRQLVGNLLYLEGDLAERVTNRSGGNPLYATQLVDDWVSRGILEAGHRGFRLTGSVQPAIPDDVHAVWIQRVDRVLDESITAEVHAPGPGGYRMQLQVALELAATLNGRVDIDEWKSVCTLAGVSDPNPVLESLLASRMARLRGDAWSFSHSMLGDSIQRIAREQHRFVAHNRLCADMVEQRHPVPHWGDSERVGRYRFQAEQYEASLSPLLRGTRERMRLEEYSAAIGLLELCNRALDQLGSSIDDPRRLEAGLLRADIDCTRRELDQAAELARKVCALAEDANLARFKGQALLVLARVHRHQGSLHSARDAFAAAEHALRVAGPKSTLAACLSEQAHNLLEIGLPDPAWGAFHDAHELYEEIGLLVPWVESQLGLARVAQWQGDTEYALTLCRRVRGFANREGLGRIEADAWAVLSEVHIAINQLSDANQALDKSIELFEGLGLARQALRPRLLKILLLLESGAVEQAKLAFGILRDSPDMDAPRVARLLMACVGLVFTIDGATRDFEASVNQIRKLVEESEVLTRDVAKCLELATERASELGFPDRASQISRLVGGAPSHGTAADDAEAS